MSDKQLRIIDNETGELITQGMEFTKTSLTIDPATSYDSWESIGEQLNQIDGAIQWWIGDWLNFGERKYGEMYAQAVDESQGKTWRNYKYVSDTVELSRRRDNLSFSHHAEVAPLDPDEQDYWLNQAVENNWSRSQLRSELKMAKYNADPPILPVGTYEVIYADPPWSYDNSGFNQSAASQYPTMSVEDICNLDVESLASESTVLFMWATSPLLPDAFQVIEAWGFQYKASMVWVKDRAPGMGWWVNTKHEMLLIASRETNHPLQKFDSVIEAPVTRHSAKPEKFYQLIEAMYKGSKIELFARNKRDGWEVWGNEQL